MTFYISGKITGFKHYKEVFQAAEDVLVAHGHKVINPAKLEGLQALSYEDILRIDFKLIDKADAVILLPNWSDSFGAFREYCYAIATGKQIYGGKE